MGAWREPDGVRIGECHFPWGTAEDVVAGEIGFIRALDLSEVRAGYRAVTGTVPVGAIEVRAFFQFLDDGLVSCDLRFPYGVFPLVRRHFLEAFGRPSLEEPQRLFWKGRATSILLGRPRPAEAEACAAFYCRSEEVRYLLEGPGDVAPTQEPGR